MGWPLNCPATASEPPPDALDDPLPANTSGDPRIDIRQLVAMANELHAMARTLDDRQRVAALAPLTASDVDLARWEYRCRRSRNLVFADTRLFGEPAWDMLLDLFIAARAGQRVPVTSACIGAAVPITTGLRWLALLESLGLVLRDPDPSDARRALVRLSPDAIGLMEAYFAGSRRTPPG